METTIDIADILIYLCKYFYELMFKSIVYFLQSFKIKIEVIF